LWRVKEEGFVGERGREKRKERKVNIENYSDDKDRFSTDEFADIHAGAGEADRQMDRQEIQIDGQTEKHRWQLAEQRETHKGTVRRMDIQTKKFMIGQRNDGKNR
jgi:hypothetical protein